MAENEPLPSDPFNQNDLDEILKKFKSEGMAVIPNFITEIECVNLILAAENILKELKPKLTKPEKTLFNSQHHWPTDLNQLFDSIESVKYFYEKDAVSNDFKFTEDPITNLPYQPENAISKLGYGLHFESDAFKDSLIFSDDSKNILRKLNFKLPKVVQSMYIFKQAYIGDATPAHRDATYLYNEKKPRQKMNESKSYYHSEPLNFSDANPGNNIIGFWLALEDADLHNGCLEYIPKSHINKSKISNLIKKRLIRLKTKCEVPHKTMLQTSNSIDPNRLRKTPMTDQLTYIGFETLPKDNDPKWTPLEVKKGDLILVHGSVIHRSKKNTSSKSRNSLSWHYIESGPDYYWNENNWIQLKNMKNFPGI